MSTTLERQGNTITITAPTGGLSSGDVHVVRSGTSGCCGIVIADAAFGAACELTMVGVHPLPADNGTAKTFGIGDVLYWDGSELTKTATSNTRIGTCWEAKAANGTTGKVKLQGL